MNSSNPSNMRSAWRNSVIDLTNDADTDDDKPKPDLPPAPGAASMTSSRPLSAGSRPSLPLPAPQPTTNAYPSLPASAPRIAQFPYPGPAIRPQIQPGSMPLTSATSQSHHSAAQSNYIAVPGHAAYHGPPEAERAAKRFKIDPRGLPSLPHPGGAPSAFSHNTLPAPQAGMGVLRPTPNPQAIPPSFYGVLVPHVDTGGLGGAAPKSAMNRTPSVHQISQALKTTGEPTTGVRSLGVASPPRPLYIDRRPSSSSGQNIMDGPAIRLGPSIGPPRYTGVLESHVATQQPGLARQEVPRDGRRQSFPSKPTMSSIQQSRPSSAGFNTTRPNYFAGPIQEPREEDKDSVMSDISEPDQDAPRKSTGGGVAGYRPLLTTAPVPTIATAPTISTPVVQPPMAPARGRRTVANPFDTAQDHLLIFLKEVKQFKWSQITAEYNKDMAHREYHTLQSRYSLVLNKRDRSQDPPTLILPPRFAAEANIDWPKVHNMTTLPRGPRSQFYQYTVPKPAKQPRPEPVAPKSLPIQQTTEHDYSSGGKAASHRGRPRRAQRINYTWPKHRSRTDEALAENCANQDMFGDMYTDAMSTRSETPEEDLPRPAAAIAVDNDPVEVDFDTEDARLGVMLHERSRGPLSELAPYLSASQRAAMQNPPGYCWDQPSSRKWQGLLLHVDFSPVEVKVVKKTIASMTASRSRHSTRRRQLRELLKDFTEPKILKLVEALRQRLPCRERSSIRAFIKDAQDGKIANAPQVQRLSAARPEVSMSTIHKPSTLSILRQRELGSQSRRGWQTAAKPLTYQVKNSVMDTMGPSAFWIGASSDIHTVAWAPDGERFAAGAVAVDDPDSMQYNRPNNLLFGDTIHGSIHELAEHYKKRERTQTGANSSHAMFASQDPKLYTTVSSVAFSASGRHMYSTSYDRHVAIWQTEGGSVQPVLGAKLNVKDQIDILSVNHSHAGVIATAARTERKAIRVFRIDEDNPSQFAKSNYQSAKAVSRVDLKMLPTALQFEPRYGRLLLAGFGANMKETGFDTTGDICLWDIQAESALSIHGSSKNIFDVAFNPNRSKLPVFAVGCVAGNNANKGMRSSVRLYDINESSKFTCLLEFECKALDINDVVWCPHDEHLVAAGCTDGRTYVWDARWPNDPLRVLSHGQPVMPLQEGIKHEITDTGVRFLSWGENATRLYSGSSDGVVKVWDVTRAKEDTFIKDLITTDSGIMAGAFNRDYSKLVIGEVNGSVNVLEVGRYDTSLKDAQKLRYVPYEDDEQDEFQDHETGEMTRPAPESGNAEARRLLDTSQMQLAPMGSLPIRQAVQGPNYAGPFDQSVDAPFLRQQALEFQLHLKTAPGPQCDIAACRDNLNKTTSEDVGDSGRSADRIPDELRVQWKALDTTTRIIPGKSKCSHCGRPARPPADSTCHALCERCSFACFRCGTVSPIAPATTRLICDSCAGAWDIGALGYECIRQPIHQRPALDVPSLTKWAKEMYTEQLEAFDTAFGDEINALSEYYHGLAIERPESPLL